MSEIELNSELQKVVRRLLEENNVELKDLFKEVLCRIAGDFLAQGLILTDTENSMNQSTGLETFQLAGKLMNALQPSVEHFPEENFPKFISVLKKYSTMEQLAEKMESAYEHARSYKKHRVIQRGDSSESGEEERPKSHKKSREKEIGDSSESQKGESSKPHHKKTSFESDSMASSSSSADLPGKEVMDKTVFLRIQDGPFDCHWKGFGMRLHVPKEAAGSIRSITVEVVCASKIQLPANTELVSPVFWIEAKGKLDQPATLELQHWGLITREEQCSSLSFIICRTITEALPQFELCCKGSFSSTSNYGKLKVNDFHFFGIIRKLLSADLVEPSYAAEVYYKCDDKLTGAFVVLPQHDMYLSKMSQYHNCSKDTTAQFTFDGESVCLGICGESVSSDLTENEGWKIVSPSSLKVSRAVVEEDPLAIICNPCKFELEWKGEGEPQALQKFVLQGSKGPKHISMNVPLSTRPQVVDSKNCRQQEKCSFIRLQKFTALLLFLSAAVLTLVLLYLWSGSEVPCELSDHLVKNENDLYSRLKPVSNLKPLALHLGICNYELNAAERENPSNMQDLNIAICDLLFRRVSELSWCEILNYLFSNKECRIGKEIAKAKGINFFSVQAYQEHCISSRIDL